jgi:tetratricopeptide (TPR) repeat protein
MISHRCLSQEYALFWILLIVTCAAAACVAQTVAAQDQTDLYTRGLKALSEKQYDTAAELMTEALDSAKSPRAEATIRFYIALARQRQAQDATGDTARPLFEQAKTHYQRAVELEPQAGGGLNNLAEVLTSLNDFEAAESYYQRAINLVDHRQSMYLTNYAQYLAGREGRQSDALRMYRLAIENQEDSQRARNGILQLFIQQDPDGFIAHLWDLARNGRPRLAQVSFLEAVETQDWSASQYDGLASCFAWCLSRLSPMEFDSDIAERCRKLTEHPQLGKGMQQLIAVYAADQFGRENFNWWADRLIPTGSAEFGIEPPVQESFCELINSLGDYRRDRKDFDKAQQYYLLAYKLAEDHLDAGALVRLADMWVSNNQADKLRALFRRDEERLFSEKAEAIFEVRHKRAYELHRALAVIYVHLGEWESENPVRCAQFQLATALEDAKAHNQQVKERNGTDYIVDQRMAATLAHWYDKKGQMSKAFRTRVDWAKHFNSVGDVNAARDLIPPSLKPPADAEGDAIQTFKELNAEFSIIQDMGLLYQPGQILPDFLPANARNTEFVMSPDLGSARVNLLIPMSARLNDEEISQLQESLETAFRNQAQRPVESGGLQLIPGNDHSKANRIRFDGNSGSIQIGDNLNQITIPFVLDPLQSVNRNAKFDFARP